MTDQNTAYRSDQNNLDDDDPLAELARIVASRPAEPKTPDQPSSPVVKVPPLEVPGKATAAVSKNARDDFDIEAELMRELGDGPGNKVTAAATAPAAKRPLATPTLPAGKLVEAPAEKHSAIPENSERELSLEEQLMAELSGSPLEQSANLVKAPEDRDIANAPVTDKAVETQSSATDPFDMVEKAAEDLRHSEDAAQTAAGDDDFEFDDFFEQNFEELADTKTAAPKNTHSTQDISMDFGDAFDQELAGDVARDNIRMDEEPNLENDFAKAFASELDFSDDEPVIPLRRPNGAELQNGVAAASMDDGFSYDHDPDFDDKPSANPFREKATSGRGFKLALISLCLALVAGIAIVGWGSFGQGDVPGEGSPQVIKADVEPAKVKPDDPGGKEIANQDNQVFKKVAGTETQEPVQSELISAREEPLAVETKSDTRLMPDGQETTEQATIGLSPKRVKTLTVKPDGTIVQSDTAPSDAPAVQNAVVAAATPTPAVGSVVETATTPEAASIDGAVTTGKIAVPEFSPLPAPETVAPVAVAAAPKPVAPKPVVPQQVATATVADPNAPTQIASLTNAPQPAAVPTVSTSEWKVQVSSQRSRDDAEASFNNIKSRFSSIVGDRTAAIQQADVEGKGTFYRVKILAESKDAANQLCASLKSAGGSCFVTR